MTDTDEVGELEARVVLWLAVMVIVAVVFILTRIALAALTPEVCVGSMTVEVGREPVVNPITCQ